MLEKTIEIAQNERTLTKPERMHRNFRKLLVDLRPFVPPVLYDAMASRVAEAEEEALIISGYPPPEGPGWVIAYQVTEPEIFADYYCIKQTYRDLAEYVIGLRRLYPMGEITIAVSRWYDRRISSESRILRALREVIVERDEARKRWVSCEKDTIEEAFQMVATTTRSRPLKSLALK